MADEKNKVLFGLSNAHAAFQEAVGWGEPKPMPGSVSLSIDAEGDQEIFYADNIAYYTTNSNAGYTGELEIADVPAEILAEMLGWEIDDNGALVEVADGVPKPFALLFQIQGDKKPRATVMYNVTANRPSEEWNTTEDSTEVTTYTLPFTATPIDVDGKKVTKAVIEETEANAEKFKTFFTEVYKPVFTGGGDIDVPTVVDITVTKGTGTTGLGSVTFEELGNVTVSQSGQVITLDGTLNHIESWPEFSSKPEDLKGYYLPLVLEGPDGSYFGKKTADGTWKTVSIADCDLAHGGMVIAVAKDTPAITFQMFASQSDATAQKDGTVYTVDLSGVTYAE